MIDYWSNDKYIKNNTVVNMLPREINSIEISALCANRPDGKLHEVALIARDILCMLPSKVLTCNKAQQVYDSIADKVVEMFNKFNQCVIEAANDNNEYDESFVYNTFQTFEWLFDKCNTSIPLNTWLALYDLYDKYLSLGEDQDYIDEVHARRDRHIAKYNK